MGLADLNAQSVRCCSHHMMDRWQCAAAYLFFASTVTDGHPICRGKLDWVRYGTIRYGIVKASRQASNQSIKQGTLVTNGLGWAGRAKRNQNSSPTHMRADMYARSDTCRFQSSSLPAWRVPGLDRKKIQSVSSRPGLFLTTVWIGAHETRTGFL
jgi:hypothetical protein